MARVFLYPALIAVASTAGLTSALLGDGIWDALAWLGLGLPIVIVAWFLLRHRLPQARPSPTRNDPP